MSLLLQLGVVMTLPGRDKEEREIIGVQNRIDLAVVG